MLRFNSFHVTRETEVASEAAGRRQTTEQPASAASRCLGDRGEIVRIDANINDAICAETAAARILDMLRPHDALSFTEL